MFLSTVPPTPTARICGGESRITYPVTGSTSCMSMIFRSLTMLPAAINNGNSLGKRLLPLYVCVCVCLVVCFSFCVCVCVRRRWRENCFAKVQYLQMLRAVLRRKISDDTQDSSGIKDTNDMRGRDGAGGVLSWPTAQLQRDSPPPMNVILQ